MKIFYKKLIRTQNKHQGDKYKILEFKGSKGNIYVVETRLRDMKRRIIKNGYNFI